MTQPPFARPPIPGRSLPNGDAGVEIEIIKPVTHPPFDKRIDSHPIGDCGVRCRDLLGADRRATRRCQGCDRKQPEVIVW